MVLENLGSSLYEALKKVMRAPAVDRELVKELIRDFQRALLQADVNVKLVLQLSENIEKKALEEQLPSGVSRREYLIKAVYEELTLLIGEKPVPPKIAPNKRNIWMLVGIQGSGKTTTAAKLARYIQKRGLKPVLVCVDTFRPGAYAQLRQLAESINVPFYGEERGKNPIAIARAGLEKFRNVDVAIVDTSGRHKEEKSLIEEMKMLAEAINPDEIILVLDGTIGQQASAQAEAFNAATKIGSIIIAKLDGSARGGGALSSVAATGAPIKFIGTGEKVDGLESFDPPRFVGSLLGMGDIESLVRKVREAEIEPSEKEIKALLTGRFTLVDMFQQLESMKKMGPLSKVLSMLPGLGYSLPKEEFDVAEKKLDRWMAIFKSMTAKEREDPRILNASRIRRIALGSGTGETEVKELIKQFNAMKRMFKSLRGKRGLFGKLPLRLR